LYDAVLLSDLHIGSPYCLRDKLRGFLCYDVPSTKAVYLLGDVLDSTEGPFSSDDWDLLDRLRFLDCEKVWVPGNHDPDVYYQSRMVGAVVQPYVVFGSGGRAFNLRHGHEFDAFLQRHRNLSMYLNRWYLLAHCVHPALGRWFKKRCINWSDCTTSLREAALDLCSKNGYEAVVCGHTHKARMEKGYVNLGCWTEDKETYYGTLSDGRLELHYVP